MSIHPESPDRRELAMTFATTPHRGAARVCRVGAANFRAFRKVELRPGRLAAIVGPNASGKTTVLDIFRFLSESLRFGLYTALERRGGIQAVRHISPTRPRNCSIWIDLEYDGDYSASYRFQLSAEAGGGYRVATESCHLHHRQTSLATLVLKDGQVTEQRSSLFGPNFIPANASIGIERSALALPVLGLIPELSPIIDTIRDLRTYSIVPDKLRDLQDPDEGSELAPDGSNAASVLRHLDPTARGELMEMLSFVVPGVLGVADVSHGNKLTLTFTQRAANGKKNTFEALQMSDGTLRLLGILLAVYQADRPGFIAIEEPEATIHVAALDALIQVLKARADQTQILLTTHSPEVLDAIDIDSIYLVESKPGFSELVSVSESSRRAVHDALFTPGELMRSGALEPTR
jgi:predicted ATPase